MENLIGQVINERYRIEEALGSGVIADAYKVWDLRRSTNMVLKQLKNDSSMDPVVLRRFKQGTKSLERLLHPNIVRFFGLEEANTRVFMLMDFVDGFTLRKAILSCNGIPFTAPEILEIVQPVCSALHYAHQMGITHGDLKPANIMIEKSGWVQVADFGITRLAGGIAIANIVGSAASPYLAPEQLKGLNPTPQTDIFALGLVLYELLTGGNWPFSNSANALSNTTGEKIRWDQSNLKPVSPRHFNPRINEDLEFVLLKCLEKESGNRYADALELLDALQNQLGEVEKKNVVETKVMPFLTVPEARPEIAASPIPDTHFERVSPAVPQARRKPNWMLYAGLGIGLIALLLFLFIKPFAMGAPLNTLVPALIPVSSTPTEAFSVQAEPVINTQVLVNSTSTPYSTPTQIPVNYANGLGNSNNSGLAAILGEWIYYRNDNDGGKIYRINIDASKKELLNSDNSYNITVSGDWVFYRNESDAGKLYRIPVEGGAHKKLNDEFSTFIYPAGEWIYYQNHTGGDTIYRIRMDGSGREKLTDGQSSFINVYQDQVYFVNDSDGHRIYRMYLDGNGKEKITDDF
ncbi:MAG TPA: DUF5050 domain-containing protein, partial [Leptolinea sp.]